LLENKSEGLCRVLSIGVRRSSDELEQVLKEFEGILLSHCRKLFMSSADEVLEHGWRKTLLVCDTLSSDISVRFRVSPRQKSIGCLSELSLDISSWFGNNGQVVIGSEISVLE
jgi:hypothetical protein